ncbi:unnamed protein product, partial [Effrenium voratum]
QELNVTASTDAKKLMGAMVAIFNNGDRAVDLVLKSPSNRSTLMYAIADLPSNFRPAAQVLLRRRDRNMRLRVLQHFRPAQDQQPEAMRISKQTNSSKLGSAIMSKFVDVAGNNLQRSAWALGELYMSIWGKGEANVPQLWLRISPDSSRALQAGN